MMSPAFEWVSNRHATVDGEYLSGGKLGFVGREKNDDRRDLLGLGEAGPSAGAR
jgi:hypothetical protein